METFFAPTEKCSESQLLEKLNVISNNPVVNSLIKSFTSFFAILDENRQVLTVNDELLKAFGWEDSHAVFGLRPGELVHCIHSHEQPSGCGTTIYCSTCGAAVAIVASLGFDAPAERNCSITSVIDGRTVDFCFKVRSVPIFFADNKFLLLYIQDVTMLNTLTSMEKIFYHDVNNSLGGLVGTLDLMANEDPDDWRILNLLRMAMQVVNEVSVQRSISENNPDMYQNYYSDVKIEHVFSEMKTVFLNHKVAINKRFEFPQPIPDMTVTTDFTLLCRVLINMIKNAFEATTENGVVKMWIDKENSMVRFNVWNQSFIPEDIQRRIFQKHFSTKDSLGRGVGTYSMKLLGEKYLRGVVDFVSTKENGTTFRIAIVST